MWYGLYRTDLRGEELVGWVEADSPVEAILQRYPRSNPEELLFGGAWTGTRRQDGSCCWDSESYPYIEAVPEPGGPRWEEE